MADERIGTVNADGTLSLPAKSISGNPNYERPPTQMHMLGAGRFVVLDIFPPEGFDTAAALADLKGAAKPAAAKKEDKP